MNENTTKTRFCPSPTGLLHLGNVRTALFNALYAESKKGVFLLRIEDTDKTRSEANYVTALQADLQWLGLQWQEGPDHDQGNGPYFQSARQAIYDGFYERLEQQGLVYSCFCTEQQLALSRKVQRTAGKPPRYTGVCRQLTAVQRQEKLGQGLKPTLRFKIVQDQETVFTDLVKGEQRFQNNAIGDFIVRRGDGTSPFMFCNAIDDALMGVTHALRGEDHLTNTPRQIMILTALNLPAPTYGHISLIIGANGGPLSKRTGSFSVQALREQGYLPIAVINYLARLGHYYPQENLMSYDELAVNFSLPALGSAPAHFDLHQLLHWQREAVAQLTDELFSQWLGSSLNQLVPTAQQALFVESIRHNIMFPHEAKRWAEIFFGEQLAYGETQKQILQKAGEQYFSVAQQALAGEVDINTITTLLKTKLQLSGKALYQPLRVALTDELHGPEMAVILRLLGKKIIKQRLQNAAELS